MKGFKRQDQLFSLCGLNCGLCPMRAGGYCPGCGGGEGNQSCKIALCSLEHGKPEYCFACGEYPCGYYQQEEEFDSFITHRNRIADLERAREIGPERYREEQREKAKALSRLLSDFNDGRRKSFYCLAVNLLDLSDVRRIMAEISGTELDSITLKEKSAYAVRPFRQAAEEKGVVLKLNRKK